MTEEIYKAPNADLQVASDGGSSTITLKQILFSFNGRVGRKIYWLTFLSITIGLIVLIVLAAQIGLSEGAGGVLLLVVYIPLLWISLAVQAKRWHDRDKSAWWILISFVPLIGPFWALIENGFLAGTPEENRFGLPTTLG